MCRWSQGEISRIPIGRIVEKLKMLGIPFTEGAFLEDVAECHGADALWMPLAPGNVSTEQVDGMMQNR